MRGCLSPQLGVAWLRASEGWLSRRLSPAVGSSPRGTVRRSEGSTRGTLGVFRGLGPSGIES